MATQPAGSASPDSASGIGSWSDGGLVSGEAVELDVRLARVGSRVLALLIDVVAQALVALVLLIVALFVVLGLALVDHLDQAFVSGLTTVGTILVLVGYPTLWEALNEGRTPGKIAVGLRVVRDDGGPIGFRQALTRALVGVSVEWPGLVLPLVTWVASAATMLSDPRGRRLGDLAAGTIVVHERAPAGARYLPVMPPPLARWAGTLDLTRLDDGLALAVRQFLSRVHLLSEPARTRLATALRAEVAGVTAPPPPFLVPDLAYLTAVLAERHRRGAYRLARNRLLTATLWPELAVGGAGWSVPTQATAGPEPDAATGAVHATAGPVRPATPEPPALISGVPGTEPVRRPRTRRL